ncbi:MAG: histidine phosphatase family protein [Lachnospiraceae bacterium]|nr:histidine phosphatase family protein [Lachnospiraceae bacterium]
MSDWTANQIELTLIRHGATIGNAQRRYIGKTEEQLSLEGLEGIRKRIEQGVYPKADILFVSPMLRCRQTAELIYPGMQMYPIPQWREMDFGQFEGKNYQELNGNPLYQSWIDSGGTISLPGGESREEFCNRVRQGMEQAMEIIRKQSRQKRVLSVAGVVHGGTIMALLSSYCGGDYYDYQCSNGAGFMMRLQGDGNWVKGEKIE